MSEYDKFKTKAEIDAYYQGRVTAIQENYRNNCRKIDEETAKVVKECDEAIVRLMPWLYITGTAFVVMLVRILLK
jgi:hypothetical protein